MAIEAIKQENYQHQSNLTSIPNHNPELFVGGNSLDSEIDGLELTDAARLMGITVEDLWRQVRNGKLIARTERGRVLVYTEVTPAMSVDGLPPLPDQSQNAQSPFNARATQPAAITAADPAIHTAMVASRDVAERQEIALLIDHLSLAKEENREILRLTTESMTRLTEMTDKMLEMKDSIISSKEEQMQMLKQRLADQTRELRDALQAKEDLETLTQALQAPR